MSTAHANSPQDLMARLETMALMSDVDLPVEHVREQIASTIDLIVHTTRLPEGRRVIARISSVEGNAGGRPAVRDLFSFQRDRRFRTEGGEPQSPAPGEVDEVLSVPAR
jgi:pilus assembly protein CpaF